MTAGRTHEPVSRRPLRRRRGMFLYAVLGLALLLSVFVFAFNTFVRNETHMSRHIMASEVAFHLAQAGVAAGVAWFDNTRQPCPLRERLLIMDAAHVNGLWEFLPLTSHEHLQSLLARYPTGVDLVVKLSLQGFQPTYTVARSPSGIVYDAIEKHGILEVHARAEFGGAHRTLVMHKQVRVVAMVPYAVSKFSLFVQDLWSGGAPAAATNHVNQARFRRTGLNDAQLVLGGGAPGLLTLQNGAAPDVEDRGFVYLGSDDLRFLNLAYGKGEHGEEHHLLRSPWEVTGGSGGPNPGYTIKFMEKGVFADLTTDNDVFDHYPWNTPTTDPVTDLASSVQLFGTATKPSATVALGQLYRRYLMFRYARKASTGEHAPLPWCSVAQWGPPPMPWLVPPTFDVATEAFSGDFNRYAPCMSAVYEEPYNRSVDFMQGTYTGMTPPQTLLNPTRVQHLAGDGDFLYRPDKNNGQIRLLTTAGTVLFEGDLRQIVTGDFHFAERATYELPASRFSAFLASNPRRIPGIVYFKSGDVTVDRPLDLADGGVVVVDGSITVAAGIQVAPLGRPLVLVSLGGDVALATDQAVHASLVALAGTLRKAPGVDAQVQGSVAVNHLDPEALLQGGGVLTLTYDERLDVTRPNGSTAAVFLAPDRAFYQE